MNPVAIAEPIHERERAVGEDDIAARCAATTLITASLVADVERLAHRIHAASPRAAGSFVQVSARALPTDPGALAQTWTRLLEAATGGTLLFTHVEEMPAIVQRRFIETLTQQQDTSDQLSAVRLLAGTTVSLRERTADGTFSERLFYRLHVNHVVVRGAVLLREKNDRRKSRAWHRRIQ